VVRRHFNNECVISDKLITQNFKGAGNSLERNSATSTQDLESNVLIFPNPVADNLTIELLNFEDATVSIECHTGQSVIEKKVSGSRTFDLSYLSSGLYFVRIRTKDGNLTKKILKQ